MSGGKGKGACKDMGKSKGNKAKVADAVKATRKANAKRCRELREEFMAAATAARAEAQAVGQGG